MDRITEFFYHIFDASLPRLGPGDDASTLKALKILQEADSNLGAAKLEVLDIGCGNGPQTLQLAKRLDCRILAVDNHQPFLDELDRRASAAVLSHKIRTCQKDMGDLSADDGLFDLVWSEGALNLMGYSEGVINPNGLRDGLDLCHRLLKPKGSLAVSELCWFRPDPPPECAEFFSGAYPPMAGVDHLLSLVQSRGFDVLSHFNLPESAWLDQYCRPLEERLKVLRKRHAKAPEKQGLIESIQKEIDLYRKHSDYYGYLFLTMRRV